MAVNLMPEAPEGHAGDFVQYSAEIDLDVAETGEVSRRWVANCEAGVSTVMAVLIERTPNTGLAALFCRGVIIMPSITPSLSSAISVFVCLGEYQW